MPRNTLEEHDLDVGAVTIAADLETPMCMVDAAGVVIAVNYISRAAVTGAASTASRTLTLFNRGQGGAGTAVVAQLALVVGVNLVSLAPNIVTLGTLANRTVAAGDILSWNSAAVTNAGGLVDPGGTVEIKIQPSAL